MGRGRPRNPPPSSSSEAGSTVPSQGFVSLEQSLPWKGRIRTSKSFSQNLPMFLHSNLLFEYKTHSNYMDSLSQQKRCPKPKSPVIVKLIHILNMTIFFEFSANSRRESCLSFPIPSPKRASDYITGKIKLPPHGTQKLAKMTQDGFVPRRFLKLNWKRGNHGARNASHFPVLVTT